MLSNKEILQIEAAVKNSEGIPIPRNATHSSQVQIIRMKEFVKKSSLSKSTLCDKMNKKSCKFDFSMPSRIWLSGTPGKGSVGFLESEVDNWILNRYKQSQIVEGA